MKVILASKTFNRKKVYCYYTKNGRTTILKYAKKFLFKATAIFWLYRNYTKVENCFGFKNRQEVISVKKARKLFGEVINND